jgi:very-short-patch-repair endonuclease
VAARQWGNVTTAQLRAIGFSKDEIYEMARRGLLHRMHWGVYAFGAPSRAPEQRWAAALLAAGDDSALSHTTAATSYGQLPVREVIEVTAPTQRRGDERLKVHVAKRFQTVERNGLTVTIPAQTLLDLAATGWPIARMPHDLAASGVVPLDALRTFARNRRGEPGAKALAKALAMPHTRSAWERRFLRWVDARGLPIPVMNDEIGPFTVDAHWPDQALVIELDTEQTHGTAWATKNDAERDAWLASRELEVWRVRRADEDLAQRLRQRLR